jgi:hypothetical protein
MPAQPVTIRTFDNAAVANAVAAALTREYGSTLNITTTRSEARVPVGIEGDRTPRPIRYTVFAVRRDGRRITNDWVQTLCAFASGANAVAEPAMKLILSESDPSTNRPRGCEFCLPIEGDPFTNRPRSVAWTCPYCHTAFTGKERE